MSLVVTEKDVLSFYKEKIAIVQPLGQKWRQISAELPTGRPDDVQAAESPGSNMDTSEILKRLDEVDRRYAQKFGEEQFREALRKFTADPQAKAGAQREVLRELFHRAAGDLLHAKFVVQEMKEDLGRRISALKSRPRRSRHGQFDKKV